MFIPLLQKERSIDDFVDSDEECRLGALLADKEAVSPDTSLYRKEINSIVGSAMIKLTDRERIILVDRFGFTGNEMTLGEIGRKLGLPASACAGSSVRRGQAPRVPSLASEGALLHLISDRAPSLSSLTRGSHPRGRPILAF